MSRELVSLDISALHVFTFNQVANTVAVTTYIGSALPATAKSLEFLTRRAA